MATISVNPNSLWFDEIAATQYFDVTCTDSNYTVKSSSSW